MTTIAWDGKTLAVDTLVTCDGGRCASSSKLFHWATDAGEMILAGSGELSQLMALVHWLKNPEGDKPTVEKMEAVAITVVHQKIQMIQLFDYSLVPFLITGPTALGSGWRWALAAMDHGKNAIQAVEYAMTRDCFTGGEIESWHL